MDPIRRLEEMFSHFPGIGPRQARRFVYYILGKPPSFGAELRKLIGEVGDSTAQCPHCRRFFIRRNAAECSICTDTSRERSMLMVVARDSDFEAVEKSGNYRGSYFILGGTVPVLDKEPERMIRLRDLLSRIEKESGTLSEIILSLNATPEGEHTADIVREAIAGMNLDKSPKVTVLGRGLSTGAELEYADGETIRSALKNRY